ncbi:MAG: DUF1543 domain-containing protein [Candidatus Moranbacteria bacterium]|nr:DUF1543 domain-containing protein [Candidatus Moranbacteria bacterium]
MKKLYIALLGESLENELVENHRVVYVVAENIAQAKEIAKLKWETFGVHIDGIKVLEEVDGYKIILK